MGQLLREFGYGWVVVAGRFISGFLEVGTVKSFGVLLPDMVTELGTSSGKIGLAFGLCHGLTFGLGPLTSALYRVTRSRLVMVLGSCISTVSLALASFAANGDEMVGALSFTGLGYSLMSLPTIMALNKIFGSRFALAYGIAQIGPAVGMITLPVITEQMLGLYGWRGGLLLLAAINFHLMITAVVTREPQDDQGMEQPLVREGNDSIHLEESNGGTHVVSDIEQHHPTEEGAKAEPTTSSALRADSQQPEGSMPDEEKLRAASKMTMKRRTYKSCDDENKEILGSFCEDNGYFTFNNSDSLVKDEHAHVLNDKAPYSTDTNIERTRLLSSVSSGTSPQDFLSYVCRPCTTVTSHVLTLCKSALLCVMRFLDLSLMRDEPAIVFLQLSFMLLATVHVGWMIFLVPHAVVKGIPLHKAVLLSSIGGVGNLIGRIFQGPVVDRNLMTGVQLSILLSVVNALTFAVDPLLTSMPVLSASAFVGGMCAGASSPLMVICVNETVPVDRFASAVGLIALMYGIGEPLGGYLTGMLSDVTHSYESVFVAFGGLEFLKALLLVIVAVMNRKKNGKPRS
ncbi:monocarboxylate transporter 12-like [Diadema antillarum]|uniref:monocarboxylate transporter 12-like n=1 Tax=Diadema antillarum TaxID=105358 RepID=UPI003A8649AC